MDGTIDLQIAQQEVQTQSTEKVESKLNPEDELEIFTALTPVEFTQASFESIESFFNKQTDINNEQLAKLSKSDMDPEIRIGEVDPIGLLEITFT